ncbi:MAG TPA: DUF4126 family protein [Solirubrobacteraceae bacterium]|nr:DUF4126 family protein [Solirubrobacteraceae bacterium]
MNLAFDICTGVGVAAAVGVRPFLPALAVGALGAGDVQIDFAHSDFSFLQSAPFLLVMVIGSVLLAVLERRLGRERLDAGPVAAGVALAALVVGALLFAGSLGRDHHPFWPGLIAGVLCAAAGVAATRPLLARVRTRLDAEAAAALPVFAEGAALVAAVLSVLLPPFGIVVLALLLWLLIGGRRRGEQKYAGLRILR